MHGLRLDHATIRTAKLQETIDFYGTFFGFAPGWRPTFPVGGVWLYAEGADYPQLHVIETTEDIGRGGMIDHIAFRGTGLVKYVEKLRAAGRAFEAKRIPETPYTQVHVSDPNGIILEMTFQEQVDQTLLHSDLVLDRSPHHAKPVPAR
jgi:catechol 2,3-dioxygenase-like lactoylglutathione lyase family enzyme